MRNIKTLLILAKEELEQNRVVGICAAIYRLYLYSKITMKERFCLIDFINRNRPASTKSKNDWDLWWKGYSKPPRIRFLNKLINSLENDTQN